jgi:hypothetical protein
MKSHLILKRKEKGRVSSNEMDIRKVYEMVTDCWKLYKKYFSVNLTDEVLQQIHDEAVGLEKKYESHSFANAVIAAVVNELGDIWKRKHSR